MTIIARAIYQDRLDGATFEYQIEERGDEGFALVHGLAGRDDLRSVEPFTHEYELRSMLPEARADTPTCNEAVATLLAQWRAAMPPTLADLNEHRRRRNAERLRGGDQ